MKTTAEEAAALKQQNAAILDKMSALKRSVSTKNPDDGEKEAREAPEIKIEKPKRRTMVSS